MSSAVQIYLKRQMVSDKNMVIHNLFSFRIKSQAKILLSK